MYMYIIPILYTSDIFGIIIVSMNSDGGETNRQYNTIYKPNST